MCVLFFFCGLGLLLLFGVVPLLVCLLPFTLTLEGCCRCFCVCLLVSVCVDGVCVFVVVLVCCCCVLLCVCLLL